MRLPDYRRSVTPQPIRTGGVHPRGIGGTTPPISPPRQPIVFDEVAKVAGQFFKRIQDRKDESDALDMITQASKWKTDREAALRGLRGAEAEGATAATLGEYDDMVRQFELQGRSEASMRQFQRWSIAARASLGATASRTEETQTYNANVAKHKAAAGAALNDYAGQRADGPAGLDPILYKANRKHLVDAVRAAGEREGLDAATIKHNVDTALSAGDSSLVVGMLADGDIPNARKHYDKTVANMTVDDRERARKMLENEEERSAIIGLTDRVRAAYPGHENHQAQIAAIEASGASQEVKDGARDRLRALNIQDETAQKRADVELLRQAKASMDEGAMIPPEIADRYGVQAYNEMRDQQVGLQKSAHTSANTREKKWELWKANRHDPKFFINMDADKAKAFVDDLGGWRSDDGSTFFSEWSAAQAAYLEAKQKAEADAEKEAAKEPDTGTTTADTLKKMLTTIVGPKEGDNGTWSHDQVGLVNRLTDEFNTKIAASDGSIKAARDIAREIQLEYVMEGSDSKWYAPWTWGNDQRKVRPEELTTEDIENPDNGVPLAWLTPDEAGIVRGVDATVRKAITSPTRSVLQPTFDEDDDEAKSYIMQLRRIIMSERVAVDKKADARRMLNAMFGANTPDKATALSKLMRLP